MKSITQWLDQIGLWLQEDLPFAKHQRELYGQYKRECEILRGSDLIVLYRPVRNLFRELELFRNIHRSLSQAAELIEQFDRAGLRNDELTKVQREMNQVLADSSGQLPELERQAKAIMARMQRLETSLKIANAIRNKQRQIEQYFTQFPGHLPEQQISLLAHRIARLLELSQRLTPSMEHSALLNSQVSPEFESLKHDLVRRQEALAEFIDVLSTSFNPITYNAALKKQFAACRDSLTPFSDLAVLDLVLATMKSSLRELPRMARKKSRYESLFALKRESLELIEEQLDQRIAALRTKYILQAEEGLTP